MYICIHIYDTCISIGIVTATKLPPPMNYAWDPETAVMALKNEASMKNAHPIDTNFIAGKYTYMYIYI
jgi:hypothetical protein